MDQIIQDFIELVNTRSSENKKSMDVLFEQNLIGNCISVLRQELDTFIRIIYLGRTTDLAERKRLMQMTLDGEKWKVLNSNNKLVNVTDRNMVDLSSEVKGYVGYVYKFGCSFVHLSDYHNYEENNPFEKLPYNEQLDIITYLHQYHRYPRDSKLTITNVTNYLPKIFDKISSNMLYYNEQLIEETLIAF